LWCRRLACPGSRDGLHAQNRRVDLGQALRSLSSGAAAVGFFEQDLAQADCVGVTSTSSSSAMYSNAASSDILRAGFRITFAVAAAGAHVRQLLFLRRIDVHVAGALFSPTIMPS